VPREAILAGAVAYPDGVHGRPNFVTAPDGSTAVGRFGWKADTPSLEQFVADAFRNEIGMTSPRAAVDLISTWPERRQSCGLTTAPKDDGSTIDAVTAFVASLMRPPATATCDQVCASGAAPFAALGCAECHATHLRTPDGAPLYSDLLLHDMGPALDDGVVQGAARGADWRTPPLLGLSLRPRLLHDGHATSIADAIRTHDGEAASAARKFAALSADESAALIRFLGSL
jgi:CxxC motif-containing protein (DUF1111 family)